MTAAATASAREEGSPSWRAAVAAAVFATLARPAAWPIALAGFLVRGGLLLFLLPIVELPTTPQLQNMLAPLVTPIAYGAPPTALIVLITSAIALFVAWLVVSALVGAWTDIVLVRDALAADGMELDVAPPEPRWPVVWRAAVARLVWYLPLVAAVAFSAVPIVQTTYDQLISPDEIVTPLVIRVLLHVPVSVALVVVGWLVGETLGGLAERRIVLARSGVAAGVAWGLSRSVRNPVTTLATLLLTMVVVLLATVPAVIAAGGARSVLADLLGSPVPEAGILVAVTALVTLWLGGLLLAAAATTFRAFAWTFEASREHVRRGPAHEADMRGDRTIGDEAVGRPGEWSGSQASGRL